MTNQPEQPPSSLPPHRKVHVDLGPRAYDVVIGRKLLSNLRTYLLESNVKGHTVVVQDANVPDSYYVQAFEQFPFPRSDLRVKVSSGERTKSLRKGLALDRVIERLKFWREALAQAVNPQEIEGLIAKHINDLTDEIIEAEANSFRDYENILGFLAGSKVPRSGCVVALGGGVVGDLAGFVAATYLRGINFVQVPTTLLAMVDSSVGGKTGVNLPEGKNLVGAFHQPKLVVADLDTLTTLPPREFAAGMAEVIKYGAIRDKALFARVLKGVKPGDADLDVIVETCVAIKARIVENDEFETKGERALLNFGHTIGHAIEKVTGYNTYLHGEAISLGMRAAAWLSRRVTGLAQEDARDLDVALLANNLPVVLDKAVDSQAILAALGNDKKVAADGVNRWVLLTEMGKAESGHIISPELVAQAVEYLRTHPDDL